MFRFSYGRYPVEIPEFNLTVWGTPREAESLADRLRGGIQQSADICKVSPSVCRGNLGVSRSQMPQLEGSVVSNFLRAYQSHGVDVRRGKILVGKLKATQKEIQAAKAMRMANEFVEGRFPDITSSVIVSKDNYILDGHHRWAALLIVDPKKTINVFKVDVPINQLLADARNFSGVGFAGFDAPSAGYSR
jgi:hypothetical protein